MFFFTPTDITTTSTTAVDIPNFAFPLNVSGQVVAFEFVLIIGSSSTAGIKFALTIPQNATFRAWAVGSGSGKNVIQLDLMTQPGVLGAAFNTVVSTGNYLSIRGGVSNGPFAGLVQLQGAKVTSGTLTIGANSFFTSVTTDSNS